VGAKAPVLVSVPESLKLTEWRGIAPATQAAVCPIVPTNTEIPVAFLVIALNPRRPFGMQNPRTSYFLIHAFREFCFLLEMSREFWVIQRKHRNSQSVLAFPDEAILTS
jgi:hypothetical protein